MKAIGALFLLLLVSCNSKSQNINSKDFEIIIKENLIEMKKFNIYDTMAYKSKSKIYKKKDTTYYIERISKFGNTNNTYLYLNASHTNDTIYSVINRRHYFYSDIKTKTLLFLFDHTEASDIETNQFYEVKRRDTIYFKNNKLYFWKNKNPSKQEILVKEKEILAIKREIDSVLSE